MPETFPTNLWTRTKWQEERDKLKVPKGAARVSMGDSIEKFHKANAKGLKDGVAAATALKKALVTYKAAIKAKYKPFYDRIERQFEYELDHYLSDSARLGVVAKTYTATHTTATDAVRQVGAEFIQWEQAGSNGTFKPSKEKATNDALTKFVDVVKKMPYFTDKIKKADALTFDRTVYAATGGSWNKKTVDGLMKQMAAFPGSV
jgi:hypothetical protein